MKSYFIFKSSRVRFTEYNRFKNQEKKGQLKVRIFDTKTFKYK